jgi:hypothetical protein
LLGTRLRRFVGGAFLFDADSLVSLVPLLLLYSSVELHRGQTSSVIEPASSSARPSGMNLHCLIEFVQISLDIPLWAGMRFWA